MTLAARIPPKSLKGRERPRIAPPVPVRHALPEIRETASGMGITLMPWQEVAAKYLTATGPDGLLFREVCAVVGRQNGKTTLMKPYIVRALRNGRRIMHIAQNRELPRQMFAMIAAELDESLFLKRRGKAGKVYTVWPRFGTGQEEILLANGGSYRIAAAARGGARGHTNDVVIIDELREMETDDVIKAAEPTLLMSDDPQMVYLSNAGTDDSVVLNAIRDRAGTDPVLAYLEWSAAPERSVDDRDGWAEANPALGHYPQVQSYLERKYESYRLAGMLPTFETEHLCRWVSSTRELLVDPFSWTQCKADAAVSPSLPTMAVSMDPERRRASAAIAWLSDAGVHVQVLFDVTGDPIDTDALGKDLRAAGAKHGVRRVAYDPLTDGELVKYFKKAEPISGQKFANASAQFAGLVAARSLHWQDADAVTDDLTWTARKLDRETGSFEAVRAQDDRPITASLAAIRAVWLASGLRLARPKVM